jgi:predicted dinucleotide-binding enzyme
VSDGGLIGIVGAGRLGQAMALTALRAGRQVMLANSRSPDTLDSAIASLPDGASAGSVLAGLNRSAYPESSGAGCK